MEKKKELKDQISKNENSRLLLDPITFFEANSYEN